MNNKLERKYGLFTAICMVVGIAQFILTPYLTAQFFETETLTDTARGEGGFGSTGAK